MPTGIPRCTRTRAHRHTHLARLRLKRGWNRLLLRLYLVHTDIWLAAAALVGFEVLDALIGGMIVAPELVPLLLAALALWYWVKTRRHRED